MIYDKDSAHYGSFSAAPGNQGMRRFNTAFARNSVNAIYQSYQIADIVEGFRAAVTLGFNGFAVAMPHKFEAARLCDELDPLVRECGSVNCVKLVDGRATGFNTDYAGIKTYLERDFPHLYSFSRVTILGTGAFAHTAAHVFRQFGKTVRYMPRKSFEDPKKLSDLANEIVFNATPSQGLERYVIGVGPFIDCDTATESGRKMSFYSARSQYFDCYGFPPEHVFEEVV